jgi:hypothetical protein
MRCCGAIVSLDLRFSWLSSRFHYCCCGIILLLLLLLFWDEIFICSISRRHVPETLASLQIRCLASVPQHGHRDDRPKTRRDCE